jgi:AcrR family transcriptional regulator
MTHTLLASDGRPIGERAQRTRRTLLDSLTRQLGTSGFRNLTVADVARGARTSPASFYQYFPTVEDALNALAEEAVQAALNHPALREMPAAWDGADITPAVEVVSAFFSLYDDHRPVLRAVEAKAAEGDGRFIAVRNRFLDSLRAQLSHVVAQGRPAFTPQEHAGLTELLVVMLAATAAHEQQATTWPFGPEQMRLFAARTVHEVVTTTLAAR